MRISDWSSDVCSSDLNFFFACQPCEFIRLERIVPGLPGIFDQQRFLLPVIAKENVNVEIIELHTYSRRNWRPGTRRCCKTARHKIPAGSYGLYQRVWTAFRYMPAQTGSASGGDNGC